jgi:cation diffusion facilitator family transporter
LNLDWILNNKKRTITLSLIVSVLVMALKFAAYYFTKSNAVLTDAAESIVNIIAAGFALYSIYLVNMPLDKNHLYGHGKIEFFSSGIEGLLIMIAGIGTFIPAIFQIISGNKNLENLSTGIYLNVFIILINGGVGLLILESGKRNNSLILKADGKHLLIDSISSMISMMALVLVMASGITLLDPLIAILLAFYIIYSGYKILRGSVGGLMDETDEVLLDQIIGIFNAERRFEWIDVHNLKIMRYGTDIHIDCHVTMPFYLSLEQAHDEIGRLEKRISAKYGDKIDFFIHTDPCIPQCCSYCQIADCKVRKHAFEGSIEWDSNRLIRNHKHFVDAE